METAAPRTSFRADAAVLTGFAALIVVVNLLTGNGYGFHRDELQFLDDARHLDWGFVAYPPLTSFAGRVAIELFGISPQVLRLPAAIVNAVSLVLTGLIARELGGRLPAQIIALVAALPVALAFASVLQYNTFDLFAWNLLVFCTARVLRTGDQRYWLGAGLAVGLGVLSKYTIAFAVLSLVAALIAFPSQRHHLRSRWLWWGALLAAVIAAPNLVWLVRHQFITVQMEQFIHARDVRHGRANGYYSDQIRFTLFAFPLAMAGLVSLLRNPRYRLLSGFYIGPFLLLAITKGRGYYLLPAYTVLYGAGAVALERVLDRVLDRVSDRVSERRGKVLRVLARATVVTALLADSAAIAWAYLPIWPVHSPAWSWQMKNNDDMANEVGWPEFVAQVAAVRDRLPPQELDHLGVLANNYGEAGALALYGPQYRLPTPFSSTNTFHLRGWGPFEPETVIVVGGDLDAQLKKFDTCIVAGSVRLPNGVRNEETDDHPEILVCHHFRKPLAQTWAHSQVFG